MVAVVGGGKCSHTVGRRKTAIGTVAGVCRVSSRSASSCHTRLGRARLTVAEWDLIRKIAFEVLQ